MSLRRADETIFLTVAGSHVFCNEVQDRSDVAATTCIVCIKLHQHGCKLHLSQHASAVAAPN